MNREPRTIGRACTRLRVAALALLLVAAGMGIGKEARADTVVLSEGGLIFGTQGTQYSLDAPGSGTLDVKLTDLDWPTRLASMTLEISSATSILETMSVLPTSNGVAEQTFSIASGGTYYAYLFGQAAGSLDLGAYMLSATFAPPVQPVPLPPSILLLLAASAATFWSLRRERSPT